MKYINEKQYIIFLDYEPIINHGNFAIYVIDRLNRVYFRIGQEYTIDCTKNVTELIQEYDVERIEMYYMDNQLHWLKYELETKVKIPIQLAYDVRAFRDKLRTEKNPLRQNTQPAFYYEYALGYQLMSKEEYDLRNFKHGFYKREYIDFEWN